MKCLNVCCLGSCPGMLVQYPMATVLNYYKRMHTSVPSREDLGIYNCIHHQTPADGEVKLPPKDKCRYADCCHSDAHADWGSADILSR